MNVVLVGEYLKKLRKEKSMTQEELAEVLHISRQSVSKWECAETLPELDILLKLSRFYGLTINEILEPHMISGELNSFEDLPKCKEEKFREVCSAIKKETFVKAYMGTSPDNAKWLCQQLPNIDFEAEVQRLGRIKIEEIESAQNEIVSMINLMVQKF